MTAAPPLPRPSLESGPFWEAVHRGELRIQRCARDGAFFFPPSPRCPRDWSTEWSWERTSGRGTVFSFVTFQRSYHPAFRDQLPYVVAIVELEEGVRLVTRLTGVAPAEVRVGMPVEVAFTPVTDEVTLPLFRPR
ncbi:MAG TPA: Zn-ribbon domain-containing OB-fold protein [Candidatus Limnocylindria bacterium]